MKPVHDGTPGKRHDAKLGECSASRSEAMEFGHSSTLYAQSGLRIYLPSPGGRIENSPRFQAWDYRRGTSRPEGTAESLLHRWEQEPARDFQGTRPSLRDLCNRESGPGSELPGYSQISLREMRSAGPKRPNSSQALLRDACPTAAPPRLSTAAEFRTRAVRSTREAGGCGSAWVR